MRKPPKILWKRGPKVHDYVPYPQTPFPECDIQRRTDKAAHASYWMVYWGPYWTSGLGLSQRHHFNSFVQTVAPSSGFTGQFAEYQEPGNPILTAGFAGEILIPASPGTSIDDTVVTAQINTWILSGVLPVPDANTVFVMMMPGNRRNARGQIRLRRVATDTTTIFPRRPELSDISATLCCLITIVGGTPSAMARYPSTA